MNNVFDKGLAYLDEQTGFKYVLIRFFSRWYWTPTPMGKEMTIKNEMVFAFKVLSARTFFYLGVKRLEFIRWITQYYPFSLMWTNSFFHSAYKPIRAFADNLQVVAKEAGINIVILGGNALEEYREFTGHFKDKVHNKNMMMKKLEKCLQIKYETIYIRNAEKGFRIMVPNNLIIYG
jgi:hypothetical protein